MKGISRCAVTFGKSSIPVEWNIIEGSCQPILSGNAAKELGIITFQPKAPVFAPINMIHKDKGDSIQSIISKYPENFQGIGKLKQGFYITGYRTAILLETNLVIFGAKIRKRAETNFIGSFIGPITLLPFAHVTK